MGNIIVEMFFIVYKIRNVIFIKKLMFLNIIGLVIGLFYEFVITLRNLFIMIFFLEGISIVFLFVFIVLIFLFFFVVMVYVRSIRKFGFISGIVNVILFVGFFGLLILLLKGNSLDFK